MVKEHSVSLVSRKPEARQEGNSKCGFQLFSPNIPLEQHSKKNLILCILGIKFILPRSYAEYIYIYFFLTKTERLQSSQFVLLFGFFYYLFMFLLFVHLFVKILLIHMVENREFLTCVQDSLIKK